MAAGRCVSEGARHRLYEEPPREHCMTAWEAGACRPELGPWREEGRCKSAWEEACS